MAGISGIRTKKMRVYVSIILFLINLAALVGAFIWLFMRPDYEPLITSLVLIGTSFASTKDLLKQISITRKYSKDIKISLVGYMNSGKTVYLTILFDEIQRLTDSGYIFFPCGNETVEIVNSNISLLQSGRWLHATTTKYPSDEHYKVFAITNNQAINKRLRLKIGDFSGEHYHIISNENLNNSNWLHHGMFFDYILSCNAIWLAIDIETFIFENEPESMLNRFIAFIQVYSEKKNFFNKLNVPICLLYMKSDLIGSDTITEDQILHRSDRLIRLCRSKFKSVNVFFVSSVGKLESDSKPPRKLNPINVSKPILWTLNKME